MRLRSSLGTVLMVAVVGAASCIDSGRGVAFGAVEASLKKAEIVHDLIEEYRRAEIRDCPESSVGEVRGDSRMKCSLLKRYLFLHPPGGKTTAAAATYSLALPALGDGEKLLLLFAVGLRPGWREADREGADGVIFRVVVNAEKLFEQLWDRDGWCFSAIDVSEHAGETIRLGLVCDRNGNNSADWALWGDPRVVLLRPASVRSHMSRRADFFVFHTRVRQNILAGWPALGRKGAGMIRPPAHEGEGMLAWFPVPPSEEGAPRLPLMRVADGSSPALGDMSVVSYMPEIKLVSVGQSSAIVTPYDRFQIAAKVKNVGEGPQGQEEVKVRLGVPTGFRLADGESAGRTVNGLGPGEEKVLAWHVTAAAEAARSEFALRVGVGILKVFDVAVSPAGGGIDYAYPAAESSGLRESEDAIILEKGSKRLAFVRDKKRFLYGTILLKEGEEWTSLGRLAPVAELSVKLRNGRTQGIEIEPARYARLTALGGKELAEKELAVGFLDEFLDGDSVTWRFEQSYAMRDGSPWIDVETSLTPEAAREVILLQAPKLLAGDGGFGASKDQAIFPGLEYLGKDECSSSTRDIAYPQSRRSTPHPLRVTIPLMAVREGNAAVGLSWDMHQKWYDEKEMPTGLFSSPNRFPLQDNHLMALVVPSVPEFIEEGTLNSRRALSLGANQTLRTSASILVMGDAPDITDAVTAWVKRNGLPEIDKPRSFEEEVELCRYGFLHSVWSESAKGWSHCVGWPAVPYPGYCTLLDMDYFLSGSAQVRRALRERVDLVVGECISRFGEGSLWRSDACHILTGELPFIEGRVLESVAAWERATDRVLAGQSPDGSWRWRPDARRAVLGKPGDTTSGMCARGALRLLREAIVTGNGRHIAAAFKALRFLERYRIPTGAQEWECPIYAPDVLAAAYAVRAFVLAYEITGKDVSLEKAKQWARTGIPFIYLWDRGEEIPQMRYAGIPIFGATFRKHSWLGRPVQWCALVYAYSLMRLSRYDDSFEWRRLAEGITTSAMWQQYTDGKSKGCYPDSWDLIENRANPADVNPEDILVNLLALKGYDPGLKHRVLEREGSPIFVTAMAEILSAEVDGDGAIAVRVKFFPGAKSYVLVAGLSCPGEPEVFLNGKELALAKKVDTVPAGWTYQREKGWLLIAVTHGDEGEELRIRRWRP